MIAPTFEISVRPAVHAMPDAGHHRVVHGGMTERAGHPKPRDVVVRVDHGLEAHDRVHFQQRHRRRGALEVDLFEDARRQRVGIDLESDFERGRRVNALLNNLVQTQRVGPELLVTKGVEAEDALALGDQNQDGATTSDRILPLRIRRAASGCRIREQRPMWP